MFGSCPKIHDLNLFKAKMCSSARDKENLAGNTRSESTEKTEPSV
jgi:hypothetical protein